MLRGFRIAPHAETPSRADGTLTVGGRRTFAVFADGAEEPVFVPPESVSLAWAARRLWSWRESLRPGRSGVSYVDFTWTLERYRFDASGGAALEWSHRLETTPPGTPEKLTFVSGTARKVVQLRFTETDFPASVFVVLRDDGPPDETEDRGRALALVGKAKEPRSRSAAAAAPSLREARGGLAAILDDPDDDAVRLAHAREIGGPRGEYIALAVRPARSKSKEEKAREKALLQAHGAEWGAALGAAKARQRWSRGFLVQALPAASVRTEQLEHPEWGLVEVIPGNARLPPADRMDRLVRLECFNTASWLAGRKSPWPRLEQLVARRAEVELLLEAPHRFPQLRAVSLFASPDEIDLEALGARLEELVYIGPADASLNAVVARLSGSGPETLVWAPDQGAYGKQVLRRDADGRLVPDSG